MSRVLGTAYRGPRRLMSWQGAAEQERRRIRREVLSWVVGASALLWLAILGPAQDALAGTDSTAARDPAVRWQFDTGG